MWSHPNQLSADEAEFRVFSNAVLLETVLVMWLVFGVVWIQNNINSMPMRLFHGRLVRMLTSTRALGVTVATGLCGYLLYAIITRHQLFSSATNYEVHRTLIDVLGGLLCAVPALDILRNTILLQLEVKTHVFTSDATEPLMRRVYPTHAS